MVKARKYVVTKTFQGVPKRDDFKLVEVELPPLKDGEILVKAEWISVDPYLRNTHSYKTIPYDQFGYQVGIVTETRHPDYPIGTRVVSHQGWCDYFIVNPNNVTPNTQIKGLNADKLFYKVPDMQGLSPSLAIGAVGMPGASAYFGFLEVCKPKPGDTVVVSGAAGAVGSLVGQIAKIKGCRVIGIAGSTKKVEWLENELGFDKAINYKTDDISKALKEAAPNGVDSYFDNVGGEISSIVMSQMNRNGWVCVCGSISVYNEMDGSMSKSTTTQWYILRSQLRIEGFTVYTTLQRWDVAFKDLTKWIKSGEIKAAEHVTEGFENVYDAFVNMLSGDNFGKAVVKV